MKGCPLRCQWCCNPESWSPVPQIMTQDKNCTKCGKCAQTCPSRAIAVGEEGRKIDWTKCNQCLECARVCPAEAIVATGRIMSIDDVMAEIDRDSPFYADSGGGVTISGGEPLYQPRFVLSLLERCKQKGYHTAISTSGHVAWSELERIAELVDLVLFDVKHMDSRQHRAGTGRSNRLIRDNLSRVASKTDVWIRVPLIPGYNDSPDHLVKIAGLAKEVGAKRLSLLPYHELGKGKYGRLGMQYPLKHVTRRTKEFLGQLGQVVRGTGVEPTLGS